MPIVPIIHHRELHSLGQRGERLGAVGSDAVGGDGQLFAVGVGVDEDGLADGEGAACGVRRPGAVSAEAVVGCEGADALQVGVANEVPAREFALGGSVSTRSVSLESWRLAAHIV